MIAVHNQEYGHIILKILRDQPGFTKPWISSDLQCKKEYHPDPPQEHPQMYPEVMSPDYLEISFE